MVRLYLRVERSMGMFVIRITSWIRTTSTFMWGSSSAYTLLEEKHMLWVDFAHV